MNNNRPSEKYSLEELALKYSKHLENCRNYYKNNREKQLERNKKNLKENQARYRKNNREKINTRRREIYKLKKSLSET